MAKTPTYKMKSRMIVVLVVMIVFGFCLVIHQLFKWQIIDHERLQSAALQQQLRVTRIGAKRGTIYDTSGQKALATSASVNSVCAAPIHIYDSKDPNKSAENIADVADCMAKMLGLDRKFVTDKLEKNKNSYYVVLKTKVEKNQSDALMKFVYENGLAGKIFLEEDTRRYYTYGNFASTVLGFTNDDNQGAYGLEAHYNKALSGKPGRVVSLKNSKGIEMDKSKQYAQEYAAEDGHSLILTIDETIQHYLEKNLETAIPEHKVRNGAVGIVMDVNTGAILAMSDKPDFDPNEPFKLLDERSIKDLEAQKLALGPEPSKEAKTAYDKAVQNAQYAQWRNKAISDPYEPGSVFKIIPASGALEAGAVTQQSTFNCIGYLDVAGKVRHCWYWAGHHSGHGQQTLEEAIMNSCNPAFMDIGFRMGAKTFSQYFECFGLADETGIDLPGEAGSIYHKTLSESDLASASFGQAFRITPIQLITAASAAVNGGRLMQPYIVRQEIDGMGNVVSTTEPQVKRQVISEDISRQMRQMLEAVVAKGSGRQAQIPGYRVGGKTGTSEQLDNVQEDGRIPNTLSFFGFAPADDPKVACLVLLDDPDLYNAFGSTVAAPIVGAILADVLPYMGIEPQAADDDKKRVTVAPGVLGLDIHDAMYTLRVAGVKYRVVGSGTKVLSQTPGAGEPIPNDAVVVLYTEESTGNVMIAVPDVVGMTAEQANQAIVGAGLNISLSGSGIEGAYNVVSAQSPEAGTQVAAGTLVAVALTAGTAPPMQN